MTYEELKIKVLDWIKDNEQYKKRAFQELSRAKIAYDDGVNIVDEIISLKEKEDLADGYLLPAILGCYEIKPVDELAPIELKQTKNGSGGGLDIDSDISTAGKPLLKAHLEEKYGKDRVLSVGTYTTIGLAPAIKDILRKQGVDFKVSNAFTKELDNDLTFEENMENYKNKFPELYSTYLKYKSYLDIVPKFCYAQRGKGQHAGGVVILPKPVYELTPVIRTKDGIATAFTESSSAMVLDETGVVKYDLLAISQLDIIDNALNLTDEYYEIIDDDGIKKIVGKGYLIEKGVILG